MSTGLYILPSFYPKIGGAHEYNHQMARHLTKLGENITVLTPALPGDDEFDRRCEYPVVRFRSNMGLGGGWRHPIDRGKFLSAILASTLRLRPDYLIYDGYGILSNVSILLALIATRRPLFVVSHHFRDSLREPLRNFILRRATLNIAVSRFTARQLQRRGVRPDRICVSPNALDFERLENFQTLVAPGSNCSSRSRIVLTVSRLTKSKGIHRVIEAMPSIIERVPDAEYVVAGDGPYRDNLVEMAGKSPVRDHIHFLGFVSDHEKLHWYSKCDVFALISEIEGFGVVYLEANAFGKPVVGGNIGGVPEAVVNGETGLLVDINSLEEIADSLVNLLEDPAECHRLGENGRHRVKEEFSWSASAKNSLTAMQDMIAGGDKRK